MMENRKIYDELYGMIEDLKRKVAGMSSSDAVTITPALEDGTKIADYTIGETEGSLFAPTPPTVTAGDYKTTETQIGAYTDGRPVYRKVLVSDSFSCSTSESTIISSAYDASDDVILEMVAIGKTGNVIIATGNYGTDYQARLYLNSGRLDGFVKWGSEATAVAVCVLVYYKNSEAPTQEPENNTKKRRK